MAPGIGRATPGFSYRVDSFEISGNFPGYFFDSFDNGIPWNNGPFGTVREADGSLILESPGLIDAAFDPLYPDLRLDRSDAFAPVYVRDLLGDFTATSVWSTGLIGVNGYEAMYSGYTFSNGMQHGVGLYFANFDTTIAGILGVPSGYSIGWASWDSDESLGVPNPRMFAFEIEGMAIDAADLTGDLHFRMEYDDDTDFIRMGFSLDGGETYLHPFSPLYYPLLAPANIALGGDPMHLVPEPSTAAAVALGLALLARSRRS